MFFKTFITEESSPDTLKHDTYMFNLWIPSNIAKYEWPCTKKKSKFYRCISSTGII